MSCPHVICDSFLLIPEAEVQTEATEYFLLKSVLEASIQILYAMFLGEWIEKHGCRLTILLPLWGLLVSSLYFLLLSYIPSFPTPIVLLASLPIGLTGGSLAFNISTFSYITRVTSLEKRSFRLTVAEISGMVGGPLGILCGAQVNTL